MKFYNTDRSYSKFPVDEIHLISRVTWYNWAKIK